MRESINILGVRVDCVDFAATLKQIELWIEKAIPQTEPRTSSQMALCHQICTVNPEFIIDAIRNPAFATVLAEADLCVPDGVGILWAARSKGMILHERVTGSDGIYRICQQAAQRGWKLYFLGAAAGIAEQTAKILQVRYPGLQVCGWYSGSPDEKDWISIRTKLQEAAPDLLFVAYGHPRQDFWIANHRYELPAKVAIGVGGAFDFVVGIQQRAPAFWQRLGLEWAYRLLHDPRRWRRMMKLPHFALLVFYEWVSSNRK